MRIDGEWLQGAEVQAVLAMLAAGGHRALLVGGCVRNALLGVPVADIDIATDARPEAVMALARAAGMKPLPTGIEHGTITVVAGGIPHQVTTFRRDVATDGRRATVAYSTEIAEDAARRDFTMNALYADAAGRVVDPLGGLADLSARRVRFVGLPADRIAEDALRILRFFRFHAHYGDPAGGIDAEGLAACAAGAGKVAGLSAERITHEMLRLLAAPDPAPALVAMQAAGVLADVLPGADAKALAPLVHLEAALPPSPLRRLAALGGAPDTTLRLSRAEARHLALLRDGLSATTGAAELAYRHTADTARDILLLRAALLEAPLPEGWHAAIALGAGARFPLRATDLMPALDGPALGAALKAREDRWIASGFSLSRTDLLG